MAFVIADRVRETTTTTGTGTITLGGAVTNFETFTANLSNSDTTYYAIVDNTNGAFEVGLGTFTASGTTLARSVIASSNSNNLVDFGAGTKDVFITVPASKIVVEDGNDNVSVGGDVSVGDDLTVLGGVIDFKSNSGSPASLKMYCESSNAHHQTLQPQPHSASASNTLRLPNSGSSDTQDLVAVDVTQTLTNKTLTTPTINGATIGSSNLATSSNGDINFAPNGTGKIVVRGNTNQGKIVLNCESNSHGQTIIAAPHSESANNTLTLPSTGGDARLVSTASTATLTNKTFGDNVSFGDNNITNVGDIAVDSISPDGTDINVAVSDNSATAFTIKQGSDNYLVVDTGNGGESVAIGTGISGTAISIGHTTSETTVNDNLTVTGDLTVSGTTTTVDSTTINVQNTLVFEGSTANEHETTLTTVDPTADRTISLPNQSGTLPVLAAASTTQITSTPEELNLLDGGTSVGGSITIADSDGIIVNDGGTMKSVPASAVKTYAGGDSASKGFATAMAIAL